MIGLPAALNGTYTATARASEDAELGMVPANRVLEMFAIDKELCCVAMRLMGREIAGMREMLKHSVDLEAAQPINA